MSGSIGLFAAVFREEDIESIEGQTTIYPANQEKWPGAEKHFCSKCGTSIHWCNPTIFPGMRMIAIGCFSDPKFPGPKVVMQTQYRYDWCGAF